MFMLDNWRCQCYAITGVRVSVVSIRVKKLVKRFVDRHQDRMLRSTKEMMLMGAWCTMKIIESLADVKDVLIHF